MITTEQMIDEMWDKIEDPSMPEEQFKAEVMAMFDPSGLVRDAHSIVRDRELERARAFGAAHRASKEHGIKTGNSKNGSGGGVDR